MGKNNNSKGTDILAKAMKRVFKEAVEDGVGPLVELVSGVEKNMATKKDLDTTNRNMQAQFAGQEKRFAGIGKRLDNQDGKIDKLLGKD